MLLLALVEPARAAFDPTLRWHTIETPHFRVTYFDGLEQVAQHVASTMESIYGEMVIAMGYEPQKDKTEVLVIDPTESANGSASALPFNAMRLYVTSPEDLSPLGDVDDWYLELLAHEYTHVLHTDNIRGIPTLVNAVLGKTLAPNQIQPRWILEGYGVYHESRRTSGGRLRNSMWDMWLRADMLEGNIATLDQMSNVVRRWPQGNLFYLYGSYFIDWIAQTYGEEALRRVAHDYGGQLIPWGIHRSIRRATGKTYEELYPLWIAAMKDRYGAQADAVKKKGIREGTRLTHHGQLARYPRWIPKGAWPEHQGGLLYWRDDAHQRVGLYALDLRRDGAGNVVTVNEKGSELVARTASAESVATFTPEGGVIFGSAQVDRIAFVYNELEYLAPGAKSPFGTPDGERSVLTQPRDRATDPSVSPDGRHIVFVKNNAGTRSVHIADIDVNAVITNERPLVAAAFTEQAFTPRWSPDGKHVAYSRWRPGGYRDVRYVDVASGAVREVTSDRAVDGNPSFSADGRWLFFHSDRTGINNVYAYELASGRLRQVTNVVNGAYCPEPSPDGKTLAYVGYTSKGFDVYAMRIDEDAWTEAPAYVDDHPPMPKIEHKKWPSRPYSPWRTLMPRRYGLQITEGAFGRAVIVDATATDITGRHTVSATMTSEFEQPTLQGSLGYTYGGMYLDYTGSAFRSIAPRGGYALGSYRPTVIQETMGVANTLTYYQPSSYDTRTYVVTHSLGRTGAQLPMPIERLDPYETPAFPTRGVTSTLHLAYSYSNAEGFLWSIGAERGYAYSIAFDLTDPLIGAQTSGFATNADFTMYLPMPWIRHHTLALHAGAGTSGGAFPGRGAFFIGSFVDLPVVDTIRNVLIQGGVTLRGYPSVVQAGRSYALTNAEYRFPIVNLDRGPSTLPIFLNRINGAAFIDYGSAFDDFPLARFKTGVGAEAWFDFTLGYVASFTFRAGYARGLASGGIDKMYFVAAVPY
ncbi:MAG: PD40 domain-containing protein [Labilithrix sp.]|nr:PD40 domain-containing protein [Labilithrix sp.]MCW5811129.1 PD40 domain-containing protein [Labilithrix sp.]